MVTLRTSPLAVFCLTSLCGLGGARAEQEPNEAPALLPAAHTDVQIGLGLLTSGLGVMVGHRFSNGIRIDGAVGTLVLINGASLAVGGSLRVVDSTDDALEIPLLVGGTLVYVFGGGGQPTGCSGESDCAKEGRSGWVAAGSVMTGLDWVHRGANAEDPNFIVSLRAGPAWNGRTLAVLPQLGAGWSF
jgi:hypothetical protein